MFVFDLYVLLFCFVVVKLWCGCFEFGFEWYGVCMMFVYWLYDGLLCVQWLLYLEGDVICYVVIVYLLGGVVGGDWFDIDIVFGDGMYVVLMMFGVIKWYKLNGFDVIQCIGIVVGVYVKFDWLLQNNLFFDVVYVVFDFMVMFGVGVSVIGWDVMQFGWQVVGEIWLVGCIVLILVFVDVDGWLLWIECVLFDVCDLLCGVLQGFVCFFVYGMLWVVGVVCDVMFVEVFVVCMLFDDMLCVGVICVMFGVVFVCVFVMLMEVLQCYFIDCWLQLWLIVYGVDVWLLCFW